MKSLLTSLCVLTSAFCFSQQNVQKNYSIFFPAQFPAEASSDVIDLLHKATSGRWVQVSQIQDVRTGIVLQLKDNPAFKTNESFRLQSDGATELIISASTTQGLLFGIYKHLRSLGFKFYLPDDLYTITPSVKNPFGGKQDIFDQPFKQIRNFFGTGGLGSGKTDPNHEVEKAWYLWKLRNGFGSAYELAGHRGENFILENQDVLSKHPEWLASPLKTNGQLNISAKINYLNKDALEFYTDWTIAPLKKSVRSSAKNATQFVSIEPSDGGGYLNELQPNNKKLPSISDQVFEAANVAAAKLDKLFPNNPNIGVNLYAYSSHAEPPSFALHPRIFVQIVPYQFQNIAFGPAFIKRWSAKVKRFGLYDYFKYPDSYWDMPAGYIIDELMNRAFQASAAGSEGTHYETSYSKFATAIPLWVLNQFMTNGNKDWEKNLDQLISDLYGNASTSIAQLFRLFYRQPKFDLSQISLATNYIRQAEQINKDERVAQRIDELKLYITYVALYLQSQNEKNGTLEQRLLPLEKIAWTIYDKKIIHSYRIMQLVSYAFLNANAADATLAAHNKRLHFLTFPESDDPDAFWKKNYSYSSQELGDIFDHIKPMERSESQIQSSTIIDQVKVSKSVYNPKHRVILQGNFLERGYFTLFSEKPTSISIEWTLVSDNGSSPIATISGTDKEYKSIYDYPLKSNPGKTSLSVPAGESDFFISAGPSTKYTIKMSLGNVYCLFKGSPRGKMNFLDERNNYTYDPSVYPSYFFMPRNASDVQYKVQLNALKIISPDGKPVTTKLLSQLPGGFEIRSFTVPANQQGKFWKAIISANYNYEFLNIPDVYFLLQEK
jgi:hypothetical protein